MVAVAVAQPVAVKVAAARPFRRMQHFSFEK